MLPEGISYHRGSCCAHSGDGNIKYCLRRYRNRVGGKNCRSHTGNHAGKKHITETGHHTRCQYRHADYQSLAQYLLINGKLAPRPPQPRIFPVSDKHANPRKYIGNCRRQRSSHNAPAAYINEYDIEYGIDNIRSHANEHRRLCILCSSYRRPQNRT